MYNVLTLIKKVVMVTIPVVLLFKTSGIIPAVWLTVGLGALFMILLSRLPILSHFLAFDYGKNQLLKNVSKFSLMKESVALKESIKHEKPMSQKFVEVISSNEVVSESRILLTKVLLAAQAFLETKLRSKAFLKSLESALNKTKSRSCWTKQQKSLKDLLHL